MLLLLTLLMHRVFQNVGLRQLQFGDFVRIWFLWNWLINKLPSFPTFVAHSEFTNSSNSPRWYLRSKFQCENYCRFLLSRSRSLCLSVFLNLLVLLFSFSRNMLTICLLLQMKWMTWKFFSSLLSIILVSFGWCCWMSSWAFFFVSLHWQKKNGN